MEDDEIRKFYIPEVIFGDGLIDQTGLYLAGMGARKVMIVTDPGVRGCGWVERVERALRQSEVHYTVYDGVVPNPRDSQVMDGADIFARQRCDLLLAVGGGSAIDCAKGIGVVTAHRQHIHNFSGTNQPYLAGPPLVCVPTITGASSDQSQFAVIRNSRLSRKEVLLSRSLMPDLTLIDATTHVTLGGEDTAISGMDAVAHAAEAYLSTAASPLTDINALQALRLAAAFLPQTAAAPQDLLYRHRMITCGIHAGMAFSNAGLGLVHSMAHALGGLTDLPHGVCISLFLGPVMAFNFEAAPERCCEIGGALKLDLRALAEDEQPQALSSWITAFACRLGVPVSLPAGLVRREDLPHLVENVLSDACLATNPREPTAAEVEMLLEQVCL